MADSHAHEGHRHDEHGHGGLGKYWVVFFCLCALTTCSFATQFESWPFDKAPTWIFMMGVSCMKAMLVILFFMHLKWEANWKYVLTIPAAMMSCFLVLMLIPDIGNRWVNYSEERKVHAAELVEATGSLGDDSHGAAGDSHTEEGHGNAAHADDGHAKEAAH